MYSRTPNGVVIMIAEKEAEKKGAVISFFKEEFKYSDMFFARFIAYDATKYYQIYSITNYL